MPTRVTDQSATLIDYIYLNTYANILTTKVPNIDLSDNFPVFDSRKTNGSCGVKIPIIQYHIDLSKTLMRIFFMMISNQPIGTLLKYMVMLLTLLTPGQTCFVILLTSIFICDNTVSSVNSNLNGSQQISLMLLKLEIGLNL